MYVSLTGNFSKSAEFLYISQPSVSTRIKSLENEIGYKLFNRNGNNVTLTKAGERFLPFAKSAWQNIQDGISSIQQKDCTTEGDLGISTILTASVYILPNLINEFYEKYPRIKLGVKTGHSLNVVDMILSREVPLGISRSVSHPQIETIHLLDDEMGLVIYPGHHLFSKSTVTVEEIEKEKLVLFNQGSIDWTLISNAFTSIGGKPNVVIEVDNIELAKHMIKRRMGIGILPRLSIEEELKTNKLHIAQINNLPKLHRPFQLIHLKDTKIEGVLKTFVDFIVEKVQS